MTAALDFDAIAAEWRERQGAEPLPVLLARIYQHGVCDGRRAALSLPSVPKLPSVPSAMRAGEVDDIIEATARAFGLARAAVTGKSRHKTPSMARHLAMYLCRVHTRASFHEIARAFACDHSTVVAARDKITALLPREEGLAAWLERVSGIFDAMRMGETGEHGAD